MQLRQRRVDTSLLSYQAKDNAATFSGVLTEVQAVFYALCHLSFCPSLLWTCHY